MKENKIARTDTKVKASKGTNVRRSSDKSKFCATKKGAESQRLREKSFPIVGVGASAGGLEAYTQLLTHLPANIGMAFVIIQHLSPEHESMLCDILSKSTKMPISEVQNGMQVKPDHGYVIPANVNMTILNGVLNLRPRISEPHTPINTFFISLAEDQKNKAIGVLLSGTGTDGTDGMKAIIAEGGITFAQNQESAKFYSMPQSAIAAGCVDVVLAPKEIARELVRISRHPHVTYAKPKVLPRGRDDLKEIFTMLKSSSGVDFTHYKHPTITRRITRRMIIRKLEKTQDYTKYLRDSPEELEALFHDLLISVTSFFRNPETFQILKDKVFPIIMKNKSPEKTIKIWVPGCSTGEEAYSIAISLREFLDNMATDIPVKIFGTDVNEAGIAKVRSGIYAKSITDNVSPERLSRFFDKVDRGYRVNTIIRDMCIFAKQDVTKDPPFSDLDLISCCNVLIYFEPVLQKRVIPIFHYALNPTGFLMLGPSESISSFSNLFTPLDKKHKIFSKKPGPVKVTFSFGDLDLYEKKVVAQKITTEDPLISLQKEADRIVLTKYAPAGVIINDAMEILFIRGHTGPYLEPAPGEASLSLMRMAQEDLRLELCTAIYKARKKNVSVREKGLRVRYNGQFRDVNFEVTPIKIPQYKETFFSVLFEDVTPLAMREPKETAPSKAKPGERRKRAKDPRIAILEKELASTKKSLQAIIEEREATNEELTVSTEEIQSRNEELQSMNEELETSKEELESTNEELTTVNDELLSRNVELKRKEEMITEARIYAEGIVETVREPLMVLDADLRVVSTNQSFYRTFQVTPEKTEKRLIYDLGNHQWDIPGLRKLLEEIIPKNSKFHDFKVEHCFSNIGHKMMMLNARRIKREGGQRHLILLAIEDITEREQAKKKLEEMVKQRTKQLRDAQEELVRREKMAAIGQLASVVGHEIRNPLGVIKNSAYFLNMKLKDTADEKVVKHLKILEKEVNSANLIISDLLGFASKKTPTLDQTDLNETVKNTLSYITVPENIKVEIKLGEIPKMLLDKEQVQRVCQNLILNAVQAMPEGGKLTIQTAKQDDSAKLIVRDTGVGIPKENMPKLFTPLFSTKAKGVGLGLVICKQIVEGHDGNITVESRVGEGSTFTVKLPIRTEKEISEQSAFTVPMPIEERVKIEK